MLSVGLLCARLWSKQFHTLTLSTLTGFTKELLVNTAVSKEILEHTSRWSNVPEVSQPMKWCSVEMANWGTSELGMSTPRRFMPTPLSLNTPSSPICLLVTFLICYYSLSTIATQVSGDVRASPRQFQGSQEHERIPGKKALRSPIVNKCVYFTKHFSNLCSSRNLFFFISSISLA